MHGCNTPENCNCPKMKNVLKNGFMVREIDGHHKPVFYTRGGVRQYVKHEGKEMPVMMNHS